MAETVEVQGPRFAVDGDKEVEVAWERDVVGAQREEAGVARQRVVSGAGTGAGGIDGGIVITICRISRREE